MIRGDVFSDNMKLTVGLPNGSVVEKLMFLVNIKDLIESAENAIFNLFTDDITVRPKNLK